MIKYDKINSPCLGGQQLKLTPLKNNNNMNTVVHTKKFASVIMDCFWHRFMIFQISHTCKCHSLTKITVKLKVFNSVCVQF